MREPVEVRPDLLRVTVHDPDGFEDAVAALRGELADAECRRGRVDDGEGAGVVRADIAGFGGLDQEGEAPSHENEPTRQEYASADLR